MPISTLQYTNNEVTVVWKPDTCIHSRICWTELKEVFDPTKRPWININGGDTERIIEQVRKCPSGALSYFMNEANPSTRTETETPVVSEAAQIVTALSTNRRIASFRRLACFSIASKSIELFPHFAAACVLS